MAAVKYRRQLVLGDDLIKWIGQWIVREEALAGRMELEPANDAGFDEPARLAHAHLPLVRVDAGERDHDVAVVAGGVRHFLVRNAPRADLKLRVDREHDQADLALAVIREGLGNRRA